MQRLREWSNDSRGRFQRGKVNKAAEMVQAVLNHQATAKEARDEAEGLQEQLPPPSHVRYLNVIASEILKKLKK